MTTAVWGTQTETAYGTKQRRVHLEHAWTTYGASMIDGALSFQISNKQGTIRRRICEASFLILVGLTSSRNAR